MLVHVVQSGVWVLGVYESADDATAEMERVSKTGQWDNVYTSSFSLTRKRLAIDDKDKPEEWTNAQWERLKEVCKHQNAPFRPKEWILHHPEGYIMNKEPINGMYIGIEPDGYAHT